jgi:hypothetical protein
MKQAGELKILRPDKLQDVLRATEAFAAVQAFITRTVAHGDVAAGRARRGVALILK